MRKFLISSILLFGLINPVFSEIKGIDLSDRPDSSICSWFEVKYTPQIYIDEARKRNLACGIPLNARQTDSGWECYSGFRQSGNQCLKIYAPQNAYISGNNWYCKPGFKRSGNQCIKQIVIPQNAFKSGNSWYCKSGYTKRGNSCIKNIVIPENAFKSGNSWYCKSGYTKRGNSCIKNIVIPENGYKSGNTWYCNPGYKKTGNSCVKSTPIPQNSSNDDILTILFSTLISAISWLIQTVILIVSFLFNDKGGALIFWLVVVYFLYRSFSKPSSVEKRKKIVITKDTPRVYPEKNVSPKPKPAPKPKPKPEPKPKPKRKFVIKEKVVPKPKTSINKTVKNPEKNGDRYFPINSALKSEETGLGFQVLNFEQGSKAWLDWRHSGIGASDASTVMGDNRFQSPDELLYQKKNKIDIEPNAKMRKGTKLEPKARDLYIEFTGIEVFPLCLQDKKDPWLIASMDGISKDYKHIVEIKCGESAYWQASKNIVPEYYYGQLQHQMMITGLKEVDYWCYWPGYEPKLQTVKRDDDYIKLLYQAEKAFMKKLR